MHFFPSMLVRLLGFAVALGLISPVAHSEKFATGPDGKVYKFDTSPSAMVKQDWARRLASHIADRWNRPANVPAGIRRKLRIFIAPDGVIQSVSIVKGSGSHAFDDSVELATYRSSPLPLPTDMAAFERVLEPTFTPEWLNR